VPRIAEVAGQHTEPLDLLTRHANEQGSAGGWWHVIRDMPGEVVIGGSGAGDQSSSAGTVRVSLQGGLGTVRLFDGSGAITVERRGDSGAVTFGAAGRPGKLTLVDGNGDASITLDGRTGEIACKNLTEEP
jgi:hypothetical protein